MEQITPVGKGYDLFERAQKRRQYRIPAYHREAQHREAQHREAQHREAQHREAQHREAQHREAQHREAQYREARRDGQRSTNPDEHTIDMNQTETQENPNEEVVYVNL